MRFSRLLPLALMAGCSGFGKGGGAGTVTPTTSSTAGSEAISIPVSAPPPSFVRSTAEAQVMRMVDVREGLSHAQAMRILTDALNQKYTVEVSDSRAGFVMTSWEASLLRDGVPDLRYRTRLIARFVGNDWRKLSVQDEAHWARGEEWDVGYDLPQLEAVAADLKAKLGKKP